MRTSRPKDFTPEEWKSLGHEHRKALAEEYKTAIPEGIEPEEAPKESEDDDKKKKKRKKKKDAVDKDDGKGDDEPKGPDKPPEDVCCPRIIDFKADGCGLPPLPDAMVRVIPFP